MTGIRQTGSSSLGHLWAVAQDVLNVLFSILGQPDEIAARASFLLVK
ncbi:MAG: hypothetical protein K2P70_18125 [Hyphomonadaceae bacterium]|nr:hypothetical protein [Hyphomonadaceae bacterium]